MRFLTVARLITCGLIALGVCSSIQWTVRPTKRLSSFRMSSSPTDSDVTPILEPSVLTNSEVLAKFRDELISLRGTPELVDRLENLAQKHPGIELNLDLYRAIYPFKLDDFQEKGLTSLMAGNNVLVTTPTGSGKTVVGELAIYFALMMGLRVAYTTPLKALSNQKFQDFTAKYGGDRVGLLTGDIAINRGAPILIMTTEVFRNMIYDQDSESQLSNLFMVCFDEFHFMNDPDRGTVWEESVISCPPSVRILALSATMGNVEEIKGWMSSIHGPTELVLSDHRPVPLRYLFALKQGLMPLFRDPNAGPGGTSGVVKVKGALDPGSAMNPAILRIEEQAVRSVQSKVSRTGRPFKAPKVNPQVMIPKYSDLAEELASLKMLPAIVFIFSRVGCEQSAKLVMQAKTKLLTDEEVLYVSQAIGMFARANPEIPVSKASVQMLRAGVGVHHAGLISVWKAFIEDLFNANKIKVLFATETLAAGVNMPARTTVISTVTKRINSEVVKLKTSQLLQMAGRAGRRGKDTEGTVVILRNRFEDVKMGHKILTSPIDGIKSHFKTSYGLTVKLLETRTLEECRALIERGFGAYLLQKKVAKKENSANVEVEMYREVLNRYTLKGARDFLKIARRLEKERRNDEFLTQKMIETDSDLVMAIADYMPLGIGLQLRNDVTGFFLGDVKWGATNSNNGFGVMTRDGQLCIVRKEHIRAFAEPEDSIPPSSAQRLLELVSLATVWDDETIAGCPRPVLTSKYSLEDLPERGDIEAVLELIRVSKPFPEAKLPGSVVRQREIVAELEEEFNMSAVNQAGEGELILMALRYAAQLKDPVAFISSATKNLNSAESDVFAWRMFKNVLKLLQTHLALDGVVATDLGQMVGSLSSDNELWLAMVLTRESVQNLTSGELGAIMCSVVVDGNKAANAFFKEKPSANVEAAYTDLEQVAWDLKTAQMEAGVDFPVHLSREAGGLVESWVNGASWRELCRDTSLDQGDVCRMLRRTVEVLRQIPNAYGVPLAVANTAYEAATKMDRFPVADADSAIITEQSMDMTGVGFAPDSIYRTTGDEAMVPGGSFLSNIGDIDPLDILFEGDDDEEDLQDEEERNNNFKKKYNSYGSDKVENLSDFETRFDYNDRTESERSMKFEISSLIDSIADDEEGRSEAGVEGGREGGLGGGGSEGWGSRKDRRLRKFGDSSQVAEGDDSRLINNLIREMNRNADQYDVDIQKSIEGKSNNNQRDEMEFVYDSYESNDRESELETEAEVEVEEEQNEDEIVNDNKEEDLEEEYSLIGDD